VAGLVPSCKKKRNRKATKGKGEADQGIFPRMGVPSDDLGPEKSSSYTEKNDLKAHDPQMNTGE